MALPETARKGRLCGLSCGHGGGYPSWWRVLLPKGSGSGKLCEISLQLTSSGLITEGTTGIRGLAPDTSPHVLPSLSDAQASEALSYRIRCPGPGPCHLPSLTPVDWALSGPQRHGVHALWPGRPPSRCGPGVKCPRCSSAFLTQIPLTLCGGYSSLENNKPITFKQA